MKTNNLAGACVLVADEAYSIIAVEKFWWTLLPAVHQCCVMTVCVCMYVCLFSTIKAKWLSSNFQLYRVQSCRKSVLHFGGYCDWQRWGEMKNWTRAFILQSRICFGWFFLNAVASLTMLSLTADCETDYHVIYCCIFWVAGVRELTDKQLTLLPL